MSKSNTLAMDGNAVNSPPTTQPKSMASIFNSPSSSTTNAQLLKNVNRGGSKDSDRNINHQPSPVPTNDLRRRSNKRSLDSINNSPASSRDNPRHRDDSEDPHCDLVQQLGSTIGHYHAIGSTVGHYHALRSPDSIYSADAITPWNDNYSNNRGTRSRPRTAEVITMYECTLTIYVRPDFNLSCQNSQSMPNCTYSTCLLNAACTA